MQVNIQTDDLDARIISALGADGRRSDAEVGAEVGLSTAAVYAQMALPPQRQSIAVEALRPEGEADLYAQWAGRG